MPTTIVTGPDGREYEVTHPAGASRQNCTYAKKNAGSLPPVEQGPSRPFQEAMDGALEAAGTVGSSVAGRLGPCWRHL